MPTQNNTRTVLVVDDNPENIDLLSRILEPLYAVRVASSGEKALQIAFDDAPPDLILLDVMMHGMDGHEVCRQIKGDPGRCDIPIIFVTALSDQEDEELGLALGAVDYITKPVRPAIVRARVKTHLDLYEQKRSLDHELAGRQQMMNALVSTNIELCQASRELEAAQSQLLQAEIMASIGQLAAGVAHEINNPIGFVQSNFSALERYFTKAFSLMDAYCASEQDFPDGTRARMAQLREKLEYDYMLEDVPTLIRESREGMSRVTKIVRDLKDFSRIEVEGWEEVDLTQGINSTLSLVRNELKDNIRVVCEFSDLPPVECVLSQLNQVFMNMLINAMHAIVRDGQITIRTSVEGGMVCVAISDTGHGIAPENIPRIFDAFYTTKPIGQGTGLGLSMSYSIVRKHHGRIDVESTVGEGTTFKISIPIRRPAAAIQPGKSE